MCVMGYDTGALWGLWIRSSLSSLEATQIIIDVTERKHFCLTGPLWGKPPVTDGFPSQRPVTRSFDVFFDLCLNKRLSNQSRHRRFETASRSLWRHCNVKYTWKLCCDWSFFSWNHWVGDKWVDIRNVWLTQCGLLTPYVVVDCSGYI